MSAQITAVDIRRAAMDLLARREHGEMELRGKLQRRFRKLRDAFEPGGLGLEELIEQATSRLRSEGLQNDERMAEMLIRYKANRGQGPLKIKADLKSRGLDEAVINLAFETSDVNWYEVAAQVSAKRFGTGSLDGAAVREQMKRNRFLQQRGFTFEHIRAIGTERQF